MQTLSSIILQISGKPSAGTSCAAASAISRSNRPPASTRSVPSCCPFKTGAVTLSSSSTAHVTDPASALSIRMVPALRLHLYQRLPAQHHRHRLDRQILHRVYQRIVCKPVI